ncbi:MAG: hypothetical protein WCW13_04220 [archaeon]
MNDEEVAFRIVRLYFEEIARNGFKRQLDLDQMINAYFYALKKLKNKDKSMKDIVDKIVKDEKKITSKEIFSSKDSVVQSNPTVEKVTTTTTTVSTEKPLSKTIAEIIESK